MVLLLILPGLFRFRSSFSVLKMNACDSSSSCFLSLNNVPSPVVSALYALPNLIPSCPA